MADPVNLSTVISTGVGVFGLLNIIVWQVYIKASASRQQDVSNISEKINEEVKKLNEKINLSVATCAERHRDMQSEIDINKDAMFSTRAELLKTIMEHRVEAVTRSDTNLIIEEKIKPLRDSIEDIRNDQRAVAKENNQKFDTVIKALSRIEGIMEAQRKRRDD
jgi:gas vesicle protein